MTTGVDTPSLEQAAEAFAAEVARWREVRGFSKRHLATAMRFDPSYISHIESGRHKPTADFARRADDVLNAGNAIWRRWTEYEAARPHQIPAARRDARNSENAPTTGAGLTGTALIVEHDEAQLRYVDGIYHLTMRRRLFNVGTEPIARYLVRISVDRHPDDPERSNQLYREHPLTWDELSLTASCQGEPMRWKAKHDRDAFKEVWLLFENEQRRFPLYPGENTWIEYAYTVSDHKWGTWFQRAVRLPTTHLSVQLVFPAKLEPLVWGTETSMTADLFPLRTAITRTDRDSERIFDWSTDDPPLHARYRMEWRFRA